MNSRIVRLLIFQCICIGLFSSCNFKSKSKSSQVQANELRRSSPVSQGVAPEGILQFLDEVGAQDIELHSFMLLRHGRVVSDAWWHPYRSDVNHIMHSVSKTVTSTAVGFGVTENLLTVDDKVISFFPEDLPPTVSDNLKELTVKDLLTMSVGHETPPVFSREDENWVRTFLATPFIHEPGTQFQYSTSATYILSAIMQKVTGETLMDYLTPRFFKHLGIKDLQWEVNPHGINVGGWGIRMKTMDMAKIGQFYLQKGKWQNKQLLPESWIEEATSAHIYQRPDRTEEQNLNDDWAQGYGYQIWTCTHNSYRADGASGQFIVVIPEKDAVIAITARVSNMQNILNLIWENLYPMMFDYNLNSNEGTVEALSTAISSLQIPDPFRTPEETEPRKNEKKTYRINTNALGIQEVSLDFASNADCRLTLKAENQQYDLNFGWDSWRYGDTDKTGPYFLNNRRVPTGLAPFRVAGYYSWSDSMQMDARLLYLTESQSETYSFTFKDDKISIQVTNSEQPSQAPVKLTGEML